MVQCALNKINLSSSRQHNCIYVINWSAKNLICLPKPQFFQGHESYNLFPCSDEYDFLYTDEELENDEGVNPQVNQQAYLLSSPPASQALNPQSSNLGL